MSNKNQKSHKQKSHPEDASTDVLPVPAVYHFPLPKDRLSRDAIKVVQRLTQNGYRAYLVGGGVRDLILGHTPKDFDIATDARPRDVKRLFRNCRIIGRRFRLAHVLFPGGHIIEVATFRRDPTQRFYVLPPDLADAPLVFFDDEPVRIMPAHHEAAEEDDLLIRNDNVFGEPHEDAIRRDFTINGLYFDLEHEEVIDYVGGMADLERGVLRMIGDPEVRFREDPIRILRAIKFSARLDLGVDASVYRTMITHRAEIARAAPPRVLEEVLRFLRGGAAHRSIYLAWELGVLVEILPELACFLDDRAPGSELLWRRLQAIEAQQKQGIVFSDAVMLASLLLGPIQEALEGERNRTEAFTAFMRPIQKRLILPRRIRDQMKLLVLNQRRLHTGKIDAVMKREFFPDAVALHAIDCVAQELPVPGFDISQARAPRASRTKRPPRKPRTRARTPKRNV